MFGRLTIHARYIGIELADFLIRYIQVLPVGVRECVHLQAYVSAYVCGYLNVYRLYILKCMSSTLAGSLVVSVLLNSQYTEFHLKYVDYDLRIQYPGYSPAIPQNLLSRLNNDLINNITYSLKAIIKLYYL